MDRSSSDFRLDVTPHPGEFVNDYLEAHGWSQRDLARRSGLTPKTVSEICGGKAPITPPTALSFEKVFGRPASFWLSLQRRYDEAQARARDRQISEKWSAWAKKFPVAEMRKYPWFGLRASGDPTESLLRFFGVSSPESWESVWKSYSVSYRQTRKFLASTEAMAAWVRATELAAHEIETATFDAESLLDALGALRRLTRERLEHSIPRAQELLAQVGVAAVWVPALERTGISGCARWLSDDRALIGISLRYRTDDQMWFTVFHEIAHLLLHGKSALFILDNASESLEDKIVDPEMQAKEEEANRFAANTLIPPNRLTEFISKADFTSDAIHDFAASVDIAPGIVVGRLQHDGILEFHQGNRLKQKIHWSVNSVN